MTDDADTSATPAPAGATAGSLLKQARQAQGLHIAALAAAMKVPQRKLEALEADRFDELPDATFTRALAQTVCRTLKIDAAPVLALLPKAPGNRLEHVSEGINTPFRERPGHASARDLSVFASPGLWAPLLLIVAAAVVYVLPPGLIKIPSSAPAASSSTVVVPVEAPSATPAEPAAASAAVPSAVAPAAEPTMPASAATAPAAMAPSSTVAAAAPASVAGTGGELQLRAVSESWIEVVDTRGQTLLSRLVSAGETVGIEGAPPLKLKIGNAAATQVAFRGQPVDLGPYTTRDNVARLTLK
jgi:cytoskeleton protein RodZ